MKSGERGDRLKTRWKFLNSDMLKVIAIVTMVIDHIGASFIETVLLSGSADNFQVLHEIDGVLRSIGRTAFPIFAFLLVEGFFHTRNRTGYLGRLVLFTALSEIPFDLAFYGRLFYKDSQNVFWTLVIGFLVLEGFESLYEKYELRRKYIVETREWMNGTGGKSGISLQWMAPVYTGFLICLAALFTFVGMTAAAFFRTDYNIYGVLLIVLFYIGRRAGIHPLLCCIGGYLLFLWEPYSIGGFLLILFYNGERKWRGRGLQYFFYLFYPVHLLILGLIRVVFLAN